MRTLLDLISDIRKKQQAIKQLTEDMPRIIGVECVREIKSNFVKSNPLGWASRKDVTNKAYDYNRNKKFRTPKTGKKSVAKNPYKGSVYNSQNPILKQSGNLRDAIMYEQSGKSVIIGVLPNSPKNGKAEQPAHTYAKHLNEGGPGRWGKYAKTNTVARKFMPRPGEPPTPKMLKAITKKADFEFNKCMGDWKI
jgi:hypothetical protein